MSKNNTAGQPSALARFFKYIKEYGFITTLYLIDRKLKHKSSDMSYERFVEYKEKNKYETGDLPYRPIISFVVPVYNVSDNCLRECIDSILNQTYGNFELILVYDKSTCESLSRTLKEYEGKPEIKVIYSEESSHISSCINTGIEAAAGEFIAFADCGDILAPNAVYEVTGLLNENKELDFIYSDEDKITDDSRERYSPHFKPDWSPDTLMSYMYTCHLGVYRRSLVKETGGIRAGFEGVGDYDFTLRFTEKTNKIGHISKILYHRRQGSEFTAVSPENKPYVLAATKRLKEEALERRGLKGEVTYDEDTGKHRVTYDIPENSLVSIIIPSKDNYEIIKRCIESIDKNSPKGIYEIVVVDNGSTEENKEKYTALCDKYSATYIYKKMDFNFSRMCNTGAENSRGNYFLFLNDDIEIMDKDWLRKIAGHASLDYVGAVGAKLYYPDSTLIQHSGVINSKNGPCHALSHLDDKNIYYFDVNRLEYNYIAVTAACLCLSKDKFYEIGGFDESYAVTYNDVELCIRLYERGYYNVVRNDTFIYHYESFSRGFDLIDEKKLKRLETERERLYNSHKRIKQRDPFFNENFNQDKIDFSVDYEGCVGYSELVTAREDIQRYVKDSCKANIDLFADNGTDIELTGRAFIEAMPLNNLNLRRVMLTDRQGKTYIYTTETDLRQDVDRDFGKKGKLNLSGFRAVIKKEGLPKGKYRIGVLVENKPMLKKAAWQSDQFTDIG